MKNDVSFIEKCLSLSTPLSALVFYDLGVPPNGAAHVLLFSQADYVDGLVGLFDQVLLVMRACFVQMVLVAIHQNLVTSAWL